MANTNTVTINASNVLPKEFWMRQEGISFTDKGGLNLMDGTFLILAGGLLVIIFAVIAAVAASVVSAVAADQDIED